MNVELRPGKPPVVRAETGGDAAGWAAGQRNALRTMVAVHGSVLVRGLGLHDAAQTGAVFQQLAASLMPEQEAFAPRQRLSRRPVLGHAVATEPADVHAPRAELQAASSPA